MTATLAIDVGQTGSRLLLVDDGGRRSSWQSAAGRAGGDPEETLVAVVADAVERLEGVPALDTLAAGLTGLQGRPARAGEVLERVCELVPVRRVVVADDSFTSYVGALGLREGVVVAAGTGVVTLATDGATRHARVDGWGYLVGDLGSGYWIGRSGLEAALRAADGRGGSSELLRRARELDGDVETLPVRLAADPDRVPRIALFAEQVADAAQAGDATARQIWADAAEHLADSVAAACERVALAGSIAVSWTGRLFDARALLLEPFGEAVRRRLPCAVLTPAEGDALDGAHRLAGLVSLPALQPLLSSAVRDTITVMERS